MSNLKKWITDNIRLAFVAFLLLTIIIVIVATLFSYSIVLLFDYSNQNCTLDNCTSFINQNSSSFVSIFANTMLTLALIIFSAFSLSSAQDALRQSKKEQQIKDIENRLEKFYIPVEDIINGKLKKNREQTINGWPPANYIGLKDLRKYSYLADNPTFEAYEKYTESNCIEIKEITCQDKYSNKPKGFTVCEDYKSGCHNQFDKCPHNLDYCEHYNECPTKDQSGIIQDNTKCEYYIDLKKKIAKDIENYKNELLILKK